MAQRGIADWESRFCGEVSWTDSEIPWEHLGFGSVTEGASKERKNLENDLNTEAEANPPFQEAWEKAKEDPKLSSLQRKYGKTLMECEIKLIMAYTYDLPRKFYQDLNRDCREGGEKYPIARQALRQALITLSEAQPPLPDRLYRKEPEKVINNYAGWKQQRKVLKQFTSTSRSKYAFIAGPGSIVTIFKNPIHGVDIAEFSPFPNEEEVLLIPEFGSYKVECVDEQAKEVVLISDG